MLPYNGCVYRSQERQRKLQPRSYRTHAEPSNGGYGFWDNGDYLYDEAYGPNRVRQPRRLAEWEESPEIQLVLERLGAQQQVEHNAHYWLEHPAEYLAIVEASTPEGRSNLRRRQRRAEITTNSGVG